MDGLPVAYPKAFVCSYLQTTYKSVSPLAAHRLWSIQEHGDAEIAAYSTSNYWEDWRYVILFQAGTDVQR